MRPLSPSRILIALAFSTATAVVHAAEWRIAAGIFMLSEDGIDVHVSVRPEQSRWQLGVRALRYTEEWETTSGTSVSKTTTTKAGPQINYLFSPHERGSWYLGVSVMKWIQEEKSSRTGTRGRDQTTAPFFGGGYSGRIAGFGYYNLGLFFSPASLSTQTADTAEETTGADVQVQFGLAF
jgi:hypothetical protein